MQGNNRQFNLTAFANVTVLDEFQFVNDSVGNNRDIVSVACVLVLSYQHILMGRWWHCSRVTEAVGTGPFYITQCRF